MIELESESRKSGSEVHALDPYTNSRGQEMHTGPLSGYFIGKAIEAKKEVNDRLKVTELLGNRSRMWMQGD